MSTTIETINGRDVIWRNGIPYEIKQVHVLADDHPLSPFVQWARDIIAGAYRSVPVPDFHATSIAVEPQMVFGPKGLDELVIRLEVRGVPPRGTWEPGS